MPELDFNRVTNFIILLYNLDEFTQFTLNRKPNYEK